MLKLAGAAKLRTGCRLDGAIGAYPQEWGRMDTESQDGDRVKEYK